MQTAIAAPKAAASARAERMARAATTLALQGRLKPSGRVSMPRADASDPKALFAQLNAAFDTFKSENDTRLKALEKGRDDVVTNEKVDKINSAVTELQASCEDIVKKIAAANLSGDGKGPTQAQQDYAKAFDAFFRKGKDPESLHDLAVQAGLTRQSDPDGGYLVPSETATTIDRVLGTVSAIRGLASVQTIGTASYKKPINLTGTTSGWVGETDARPETNTPKLDLLEFTAMELYANPGATQSMLDDSQFNIETWLADEVAIQFAEQEGAAFATGNGVAKPKGIFAYPIVANGSYSFGNVGYVASGGASDFASSNPTDAMIDLTMAVKQGYRQNAHWLMNRLTQGKVRKFKDGQGNYIWQPGAQAGQPAVLLGYPVTDDDNCPDVAANSTPIAFGDFKRGYLIVDRMGVRVLRDPYTNKPYVYFYTTKRVGGGIQNFEAIKVMKIATS